MIRLKRNARTNFGDLFGLVGGAVVVLCFLLMMALR
jgi:hypothetical protein